MNPISNLILYNCKLDRTMHKTIDFSSQSARDSYFSSSNAIATIISVPFNGDAYFIRENMTIKVGINADVLDFNGVNYCRFNNPQSGTNNFFYAFIDDIEYSAPYTSILHIRTDVMLTNMKNFTTNECFVERSHIAKRDDIYYNQLTAEPVDLGDTKCCGSVRLSANLSARTLTEFLNNYDVIINMSEKISGSTGDYDYFVGGTINSSFYYSVDGLGVDDVIDHLNTEGQIDAVISIFAVPTGYITKTFSGLNVNNHTVWNVSDIDYTALPAYLILGGDSMANGYTPRNKKLLTYPYDYVNLTNYSGSSVDCRYEFSEHDSRYLEFKEILSIANPVSLFVFPINYNTQGTQYSEYIGNYEFGIEFNNFPEIAWTSDTYSTYLALNKNSLQMQQIDRSVRAGYGVGKSLANFAMNPTISSFGDVAVSMYDVQKEQMFFDANMKDMQAIPDKIQGKSSGGVSLLSGMAGIFGRKMSLRTVYAQKIDKYFDMYGYNISAVQTPNFTNRSHYNYIKTTGIDIYGPISKNDKETIANLFDSGVTIWHISGGGVYGTYDTNNE